MWKILAAFIFFTRLPFWKLGEVPAHYFKNIVSHWALVGWLTSGIMVFTLYAASLILPAEVALLLAILSRLLVTGCLHEDGLADFFDGFGGGTNRERILTIMKDSHIGSYGVISLIFYFSSLYSLLHALPLEIAGSTLLAGDPFCKGVSSMIINRLPYARKEEEAKNKTIYSRMTGKEYWITLVCASLPLLWLPDFRYAAAIFCPILTWVALMHFMDRKIQGYTGDCCGATFLLTELSFYFGIASIHHLITV